MSAKEETEETRTKLCDFCRSEISFKATRCRFCTSVLTSSSSSVSENKSFSVVREEINSGGRIISKVFIIIKDFQLSQTLRSFMGSNDVFFEKEPKINADELFALLPQLRKPWVDGHKTILAPLLEFIEQENKESMLAEGLIPFDGLWYIFTKGSKLYATQENSIIGSSVNSIQYLKRMISFFVIDGEVIKSNGEVFYTEAQKFVIPEYEGLKKISELPIKPMNDEILQKLNERGSKFMQLAMGSHYMTYKGKMFWSQGYFSTQWRADGRVMCDIQCFNRTNPNYREFNRAKTSLFSNEELKTLPKEVLFKTWPTVAGFSFAIKKWGEIYVDNCKPVIFDDHAFDKLVLPMEKKDLIKALVLNQEHTFSDIISGKGAGCIFLLHGPPGVGKTLTAEAIAELLHLPLYSVTVGELGTDPSQLESKLREILEVASVWKSVILIDEADIFLERRTRNDIMRNAMVGIFLRLLEYHQGVLFLTTNLVEHFDEAFHSRISIALRYDELDKQAREQVWKNFFQAANIQGIEPKALSDYALNGRQIRSTIRLAQALAKSENKTVSLEHIERTVKIASQFQSDLKNIEENHSTSK